MVKFYLSTVSFHPWLLRILKCIFQFYWYQNSILLFIAQNPTTAERRKNQIDEKAMKFISFCAKCIQWTDNIYFLRTWFVNDVCYLPNISDKITTIFIWEKSKKMCQAKTTQDFVDLFSILKLKKKWYWNIRMMPFIKYNSVCRAFSICTPQTKIRNVSVFDGNATHSVSESTPMRTFLYPYHPCSHRSILRNFAAWHSKYNSVRL